MELLAGYLCDMAFARYVFDQHHFAGANHATLTIARDDLNLTLENDYILPARRWMRLRKRLRDSTPGSLYKGTACGR
jgi:hypothetical protein